MCALYLFVCTFIILQLKKRATLCHIFRHLTTATTFCGHCFHSLHFLIAIFTTLCHIIAIFLFIACCCWHLGSACHIVIYTQAYMYVHTYLYAAIHQAITVRCTLNIICMYVCYPSSLSLLTSFRRNLISHTYLHTHALHSFSLLMNLPDLSVFRWLNEFIAMQTHNLSSVLKCFFVSKFISKDL